MKNKYRNLILIFLIGAFILMPNNTFAKEKLGTCTYKLSSGKMYESVPGLRGLTFKITVYDDGSTGNRKMTMAKSDYSEKVDKALEPGFINDVYSLTYKKMFDKNGKYYKKFEEYGGCPPLKIALIDGTQQVQMTVEDGDYVYDIKQELKGTISGKSDKVETKENKIWCKDQNITRTPTYLGSEVTFQFYTDTRGKNMVKITGVSGETNIAEGEMGTLGTVTFYMADNLGDYWSDKCKDQTLYCSKYNGTFEVIEITKSKPNPEADACNKYDISEYDDGSMDQDASKDSSFDSILSGTEQDCESIFGYNASTGEFEEGNLGWFLQKIFNWIKVIGPILVVLMSGIDFAKTIVTSDEKSMKAAEHKLVIRLICAIGLFLIPSLVILLLKIFGSAFEDPTCGIK